MNPYIKTKNVPLEKVHFMLNPPPGGVRSKEKEKKYLIIRYNHKKLIHLRKHSKHDCL